MSTAHAQLVRDGRRFTLIDAGSKTGTVVNGRRVDTCELADGDVIEAGHTFFLYRTRVPAGLTADPAWYAESSTGELPLTTFMPSLASNTSRSPGWRGRPCRWSCSARPAPARRWSRAPPTGCRGAPARSSRSTAARSRRNLIESELFGAKRGAFSGAIEDRPGLDPRGGWRDAVPRRDRRAADARRRSRCCACSRTRGAPDRRNPARQGRRADRAATHGPLDRLVDSASFRADLFARLGGLTIRLPPLRERREDLGLISVRMIRADRVRATPLRLSRPVGRAVFSYPFPHNIRELEKAIGLGIAVATAARTRATSSSSTFPRSCARRPRCGRARLPTQLEDEERRHHIIALLTQHHGRVADVARAMGKARMQIDRWIQRYGIDLENFRK